MAIREANVLDAEVLAQVHADVWASVFNGTTDGTTSGVPNSLNDAAVATSSTAAGPIISESRGYDSPDDDAAVAPATSATAEFVAGTYRRSLRHLTDVFAGKVPATGWLAVVDGQLVGFAEAEAKGPHEVRFLKVSLLYVLPEFQGRGVGSALLQRAIGDAPAYVWTRPGLSQQFYEKHGFVADGEVSELAGMTVVRLLR